MITLYITVTTTEVPVSTSPWLKRPRCLQRPSLACTNTFQHKFTWLKWPNVSWPAATNIHPVFIASLCGRATCLIEKLMIFDVVSSIALRNDQDTISPSATCLWHNDQCFQPLLSLVRSRHTFSLPCLGGATHCDMTMIWPNNRNLLLHVTISKFFAVHIVVCFLDHISRSSYIGWTVASDTLSKLQSASSSSD